MVEALHETMKSDNSPRMVRNSSTTRLRLSQNAMQSIPQSPNNSVSTTARRDTRCVVCCNGCLSGNVEHKGNREGFKTAATCGACSQSLFDHLHSRDEKIMDLNRDKIPLCQRKRYELTAETHWQQYANLTCYEIYHQCEELPKCLQENTD